jgi:nucleotide-binding universal stress UspA family protein
MSTPVGEFELGTDGVGVIVAGVDRSEPSMRAASFAAGMARREGSRLVCVYVAPIATGGGNPDLAVAQHAVHQEIVDALERDVHLARSRYGTIAVELVVRSGDPTREITKVADEMRADNVVVGRAAKAGHDLIGSTGRKLVKTGHWPVTIVP